MGISEQIQKDMVAAMRSREELRLSTLRMVKSALKNKEIDKRAPLDEKEVQQVLSTLIKQRRDSIDHFQKGGRQELADKEAAEIAIIESYLPKALGEEDVAVTVKATIAEMGSPTIKDMGTVMKNVMAKLQASGGRVDGKIVSDLVKKALSGS
ncbi:MAG TPA: GatB/YqeY domain-containing protein [Candidatus Angelobacter sp.]|nr:GatB/YqeY domain-containing protein [Candidatus Angelobacter sp.]